jgi:hypothetical protein
MGTETMLESIHARTKNAIADLSSTTISISFENSMSPVDDRSRSRLSSTCFTSFSRALFGISMLVPACARKVNEGKMMVASVAPFACGPVLSSFSRTLGAVFTYALPEFYELTDCALSLTFVETNTEVWTSPCASNTYEYHPHCFHHCGRLLEPNL